MSVKLLPQKLFLIAYDDGYSTQTIKVPVELYVNEKEFRQNIISFECLHCGAKSYDECLKNEESKLGS